MTMTFKTIQFNKYESRSNCFTKHLVLSALHPRNNAQMFTFKLRILKITLLKINNKQNTVELSWSIILRRCLFSCKTAKKIKNFNFNIRGKFQN